MRKLTGLIVALSITLIFQSPVTYASTKQEQFIQKLKPLIYQANNSIYQKRKRLKQIAHQYHQKGTSLKKSQKHWLDQVARHYNIHIPDWSKNKTWQNLFKRVDQVPTSLTLAQAAIESAWGKSRFAKQANNFFGQHCYKKDCGLVPKKRAKGRTFEVRKFKSPLSSIKSYLHNLNTGSTYKHLRQIRYKLRQQDKPLSGITMAAGLDDYSQSPTYIKNLRSIIKQHHLEKLNKN